MTREHCTRCGLLCQTAGYPRPVGPALPALARDGAGRAVCDHCTARETTAALDGGQPATAYLSADGRALTSWGGAPVARVLWARETRAGYGGGLTVWRAVLPSGREVYGRNGGRGMVTTARPARGPAR